MSDPTNQRKLDHLQIAARENEADRQRSFFNEIHLTHRALPELNLEDVDTSCTFLGKTLSFPLLISAMTGGDHELALAVNRNLARAAEETGVAMSVGSQRVMFTHPAARESFALRSCAPTAPLIANLGAVQLNHGFDHRHGFEAVDVLQADALCLHLNPLQEAIQPKGNTAFRGVAGKIGAMAEQLPCPLLVKEVGCGISPADALLLRENGVRIIDLAGAGGTSWSYIEHLRHEDRDASPGLAFQDWGIPTPKNIELLRDIPDLTLIASGGVRTGIDMVKALVLGASLCGIAAPLLKPALESADAVIRHIRRLQKEFAVAQFLLGIPSVPDLIGNRSLLL